MSTIVWLVIAWFVGRRYWKKSPALREYVKLFLGGHPAERAAAMLVKEKERREAQKTASLKSIATQTKTHTAPKAAFATPILKTAKKSEKQFQEL